MDVHSVPSVLGRGEEGHEMLSLNRRLETYLSRVKTLQEDNAALAKEVWSLRRGEHRALTRRRGLEDELRQARLQLDAAWGDRVRAELQVAGLTDELQGLSLCRHREAQAHVKATATLERSRKELEEEQRAQVWLRAKVGQLESEMRLLLQNHRDDVAHLEAAPTRWPTLAPRADPTPDLLQLGQQFAQTATAAWQEAAGAYQNRLAGLEETLSQTRSLLSRAAQERSHVLLRLRSLQQDVVSAQDVRTHLEERAARQAATHSREVRELQEHLDDLEDEKEELSRQINGILLENRGLLTLKMHLGLEVAAYRALLDGESLTGQTSFPSADAALWPREMTKHRQTQRCATIQTKASSSICGATGAGLTVITAKPACSSKPLQLHQTTKASEKTSYPKILQDGAVENVRPRQVCEKVTRAELLSSTVEVPEQIQVVQAAAGSQVGPGHSSDSDHQLFAPSNLTPELLRTPERPRGRPSESDEDVSFEGLAESEELQEQPPAPVDAQQKVDSVSGDIGRVHEDAPHSEAEALPEPTAVSGTSSPASEREPEESGFNPPTDVSVDESVANGDAAEKSQETVRQAGWNEADVEDKLYPDGEEMDTWDSVIEKKVDVKAVGCITTGDESRQHAEPEEDISAKEPQHEHGGVGQDVVTCAQESTVTCAVMDAQDHDTRNVAPDQDDVLLSDAEDDDSQNVSVSWRTEVEGDSYAQENTLADTRPLIHYKSDEADAHADDSELSESDQEKMIGETGTWSEGKTRKFGTMDDLCEEAEGEMLEEEYDLEYARTGDRKGRERVAPVKDAGNAGEMTERANDGRSGEEEAAEPLTPTDVDYEEELDTDGLVERELENLRTDRYSARFAQRQHGGSGGVAERGESGPMETQATFSWEHREPSPSTATVRRSRENLHLGDSSASADQTESPADGELRRKDGATAGKREEDDRHAGDQEGDVSGSGPEDMNQPKDSDAEREEDGQQVAGIHQDAPAESSSESQELPVEDVADCRWFPDAAEASEWEKTSEEAEIRGDSEHGQTREDVPESDDGCHHDDKGSEEGVTTRAEEPAEVSPDSGPDDGSEIFVVKDPKELPDPYDVFSSAIKSDSWASCAESGATYGAAEPTNQNLGFGENVVWGDVEKTNALNGNPRPDSESGKALDAEVEQMFRNAAGELVHSEESEAEEGSWSSGEEPI